MTNKRRCQPLDRQTPSQSAETIKNASEKQTTSTEIHATTGARGRVWRRESAIQQTQSQLSTYFFRALNGQRFTTEMTFACQRVRSCKLCVCETFIILLVKCWQPVYLVECICKCVCVRALIAHILHITRHINRPKECFHLTTI